MSDQTVFCDAFVKFDKRRIYSKACDNKLFLLLAFLGINSTHSGRVISNLEFTVQQMGYKPNQHRDRINSGIVSLLSELIQNDYISVNCDINQVKPKELFVIQINRKKNPFDLSNNYVLLTESEFYKITQLSTDIVGKDTLLRIFLVIKSFINNDSALPQIGYPSIATIKDKAGVQSNALVEKAVKALEDNKLIYVHHTGSYLDSKGKRKNANNFYALNQAELDKADCKQTAIQLLKNKNKNIEITDFGKTIMPNVEKSTVVKPVEQNNKPVYIPNEHKKIEDIETAEAPKFTWNYSKAKQNDFNAEFFKLLEEEE